MNCLKGWQRIGQEFGATGKRVKEWASAGAPIQHFGAEPVADMDGLWQWLLENRELAGDKSNEMGISAAAAKNLIPESGEKALLAAVLTGKRRR